MAGEILEQLICDLNTGAISPVSSSRTNKQIAGFPVIRQVVGEGANRFAKFGRIVRGNGTLHIIGLYICQKRLDFFIGQHGTSLWRSNSASLWLTLGTPKSGQTANATTAGT